MKVKARSLDVLHSFLSKSEIATRVALKVKNQAELVIKRRYSVDSCNPAINGEFMLLENIASHCQFFIDIGANTGVWTDKLLTKSLSNTQGMLFEPGVEAHKILSDKFITNPLIQVFNLALSDSVGESVFYEQPSAGEMSSFIQTYTETSSNQISLERNVLISTLENEVSRAGWKLVDFVKIDTEGYDFKVLKGALPLLQDRAIGIVQFEYNEPWKDTNSTLVQAYQLLRSCGYQIYHLSANGLLTYDIESFGDYYSYSNYVCVAPSHIEMLQPLLKGKI